MDKTGYFVIGVIIIFIISMFYLSSSSNSTEPYFSDSSPVLYFYREDCVHCVAMKPILSDLAKEGFRVKPMEFYSHPEDATKYSVQGTPTWINPLNNDKLVGETSIEYLRTFLLRNKAKIA